MNYMNSFPRPRSLARLIFLAVVALAALDMQAQTASQRAGVYQRISLKASKPCAVAASGEVTALVKNGVELSVTEDWDCDGVADAYDNCVGMPNPAQTDSDRNGIGDICEAATLIKAGLPARGKSDVKATIAKARPADRRSRSNARKRRIR